jgi:1,4-alpha-glucan branching enzyme
VSLLRRARNPDDFTVMLVNFTPVPREAYIIGVPAGGWYREVLNSDAAMYGGSNVGNAGGIMAEEGATHGFDYSLSLTVPPLGFVLLKR